MMTYALIAFTALISIPAFSNQHWFLKLQFNPYQIYHRKQWYRLLTHGFLHANWTHLIVNMLVLFFFGPTVEAFLKEHSGTSDVALAQPCLSCILFWCNNRVFAHKSLPSLR